VTRYYLAEGGGPERETDRAGFVAAERRAGFVNTLGMRDWPATAGFSAPVGEGGRISGRVELDAEGIREEIAAYWAAFPPAATS
jgi:hypothetical protein